jgi:hypothetical protein
VRQEEGRLVVGACGVPPPALMLAQHRNCSCAMSMLCFARTLDCSLAHALAFLTAMCDCKKSPRHPPPSLHVTGLPVQRRGAVGKGKWDRASRARAWGDLILPGSMRAGPASCVLGQCPCSALFPCVPQQYLFSQSVMGSRTPDSHSASPTRTRLRCAVTRPPRAARPRYRTRCWVHATRRACGVEVNLAARTPARGTSDCVVDSNHRVGNQ